MCDDNGVAKRRLPGDIRRVKHAKATDGRTGWSAPLCITQRFYTRNDRERALHAKSSHEHRTRTAFVTNSSVVWREYVIVCFFPFSLRSYNTIVYHCHCRDWA